jgi:hypothetical protein
VLTLGLGPAVGWATSFGRFVAAEREQFTRFADWLRRHSIRPEADAVRAAAAAMGVHPLLTALPAAAVAGMFAVFSAFGINELSGVLRHTYLFPLLSPKYVYNWSWPFIAWNAGLALAYLSQCLVIFLHRLDVQRFVSCFNELARVEGLSPIRLSPPQRTVPGSLLVSLILFLGPEWLLVTMVLLFFCHAPSGLALALTGVERSYYLRAIDPAVRTALAQRVTDMVLLRKRHTSPTLRVFGRCRRDGCGAPLPELARFCPRCGLTLSHQAAGDSAGHAPGARR